MNKISETWKAFLDALIDAKNDKIENYYDSLNDISFEKAMSVVQKALKDNGVFEK